MTRTARQHRARQVWLAVHRYSGLAILVFLAIAALTGCLLCFEHPLDRMLNPALFASNTGSAADPLAAVARLEQRYPELIATEFPVRAEPGRTIAVSVAPANGTPLGYEQVFLDGRGEIIGRRSIEAGSDRAHWMQTVYLLHYTLLAGTGGRWLMGVVAVLWLLSNLVGAYLTLPLKPPYLRQWKRAWTFRISSPLPRLLLDIHRASALWLILPLTVLAFTSMAMNFFSEAFVPTISALSPPHRTPFDAPPPPVPTRATTGIAQVLPHALALAASREPGWRPAAFQHEPDRNLLGIRFTRSGEDEYSGLGPVTYWFDGASGRLMFEDSPYTDSAGQKLSRALFPLHTGQMIGTPGIMLDLVLGLATLEMCGTGIYLWLKRRGPRVALRRQRRAFRAATR